MLKKILSILPIKRLNILVMWEKFEMEQIMVPLSFRTEFKCCTKSLGFLSCSNKLWIITVSNFLFSFEIFSPSVFVNNKLSTWSEIVLSGFDNTCKLSLEILSIIFESFEHNNTFPEIDSKCCWMICNSVFLDMLKLDMSLSYNLSIL